MVLSARLERELTKKGSVMPEVHFVSATIETGLISLIVMLLLVTLPSVPEEYGSPFTRLLFFCLGIVIAFLGVLVYIESAGELAFAVFIQSVFGSIAQKSDQPLGYLFVMLLVIESGAAGIIVSACTQRAR